MDSPFERHTEHFHTVRQHHALDALGGSCRFRRRHLHSLRRRPLAADSSSSPLPQFVRVAGPREQAASIRTGAGKIADSPVSVPARPASRLLFRCATITTAQQYFVRRDPGARFRTPVARWRTYGFCRCFADPAPNRYQYKQPRRLAVRASPRASERRRTASGPSASCRISQAAEEQGTAWKDPRQPRYKTRHERHPAVRPQRSRISTSHTGPKSPRETCAPSRQENIKLCEDQDHPRQEHQRPDRDRGPGHEPLLHGSSLEHERPRRRRAPLAPRAGPEGFRPSPAGGPATVPVRWSRLAGGVCLRSRSPASAPLRTMRSASHSPSPTTSAAGSKAYRSDSPTLERRRAPTSSPSANASRTLSVAFIMPSPRDHARSASP